MKRRISRANGATDTARRAIACAIAAFALSSCGFDDWHADIGDFVERGLSLTKLVSFTYAQEGTGAGGDVAHGSPVTVTARVLNPKELDLAYTLSYDETMVESESVSAVTGGPTVDGYTTASFTFTPTALAEHGNVAFALSMRSPSINKDFETGSITVRCDEAPAPVGSITAGPRSDGRACVAFLLPDGYENADIASARIRYSSATAGTDKTVTEPVSRDGTNLTSAPDIVLLDADSDEFVRYYVPDDVVAGNPYSFTVTLIDASGKESAPATANVAGNELTLAFDANGGTGSVGARFGFNGTSVAIPSGATLTKEGAAFAGWNAERDGTGTTFMPGAGYTFAASGKTLYAQWTKLCGIQVSLLSKENLKLVFNRAGYRVTSACVDKNGTLTIGYQGGADAYQWYRNGNAIPGATASAYSFTPASIPMTSGTCVISVTAKFGDVLYSGDLTVTVTDDYMVTIIPKGQKATFILNTSTNTTLIPMLASTHTLTQAYQLARYEVSYELWTTVTEWALAHGYDFNRDTETGTVGIMGMGESTTESHPVTAVSDLVAMLWCNAYSEMTGATPCYYLDRDKTDIARKYDDLSDEDLIEIYSSEYVKWDSNGYRLPTRTEWYYAASCCNLYAPDHVSGCAGADYSNTVASAVFANVHTDETVAANAKTPNAWGLYNMSGNVWEYCFDRYSEEDDYEYVCDTVDDVTIRVTCGGTCKSGHPIAKSAIGFKAATFINGGGEDDGFRIARSIP